MPAFSLRSGFRGSTFFWLLTVSLVIFLETLVHEWASGVQYLDRVEKGVLLLFSAFFLSFHHESPKIVPRLLVGAPLLLVLTALTSWLTSLEVILCI